MNLTKMKKENESLSEFEKENGKMKAVIEHTAQETHSLKNELGELQKVNEKNA